MYYAQENRKKLHRDAGSSKKNQNIPRNLFSQWWPILMSYDTPSDYSENDDTPSDYSENDDIPNDYSVNEIHRAIFTRMMIHPVQKKETSPNLFSHARRKIAENIWCLVPVAVLIIVGCASHFIPSKPMDLLMKHLQSDFPNQSSLLWGKMFYVLNDNNCPRVLLLLSGGDKRSEDSAECLIDKLVYYSAKLLNQNSTFLDAKDLDCYNCTTKVSKRIVDNGPFVIMKQIHKLSAAAAKQLHFFCDDQETDFVKAGYFLTMSVDASLNDEKPTKYAEKKIRGLWSSELHENTLDPIIARITSSVQFVKPEENLPCQY